VTADAPAVPSRIDVVDLGRGAVMALMALDHTRTFFTDVTYNPSDLERTFPALFFTRWISHFCTPLFLFLAGSGAYFMSRKRERGTVAWFLVTRGIALLVLELTVVRWGWYFNLDYRHTSLQILWSIGVSMMALAPLLVLPTRLVGAIGFVRADRPIWRPLITIGRVPMAFYLDPVEVARLHRLRDGRKLL
jgi:uncharacterized membrane protein